MRTNNANSVTFGDVSRYVSLAAAMILTAHAEHELAVSIGVNGILAWLFPVCLDLYAAAAFRAHARRDIGAAITLMIVCQTLAHLIAAGIIAPAWWLIIPVSAVVPIVLWRGHTLSTKPAETVPEPAPLPETAAPAPTPVAAAAPIPERITHPMPWPTHRAETVLADIAAAPNPPAPAAATASHHAASAPVTRPANRTPRKSRVQRLNDLREIITARPDVDQIDAARHMKVSDRYLRDLVAGSWEDFRATVAATA